MKQTLYIISFFIFIFSKTFSQDFNEYYFKFEINNKSELDTITRIISVDNVKDNIVYAYALQHELGQFKELGYKLEFLQKDVPKSITMATTVAEMASWDRYPTYEVYRQMMKDFESNYPTLCKLDSIGTTRNGRQLYVLKISDNVNVEENEPEFFYTSTIHGDETTGFILLLRLADSLLTSYSSSTNIKNLVDEISIFINPNANPDGTYNGGNSTISNAIRSNGYADLNRDFPDPGTGTNSPYQPETQAMMNFAQEHSFVMSANFHGGVEVMNYPWDTWTSTQNPHPDTEWFEYICTDYVTTARTVLSNYMSNVVSDGVTEGGDWYVITGGRQDYMNYWHQCREVTMEISSTKLLEVENLNDYWNYNKQSLLNYMNECLFGVRGKVKSEEGLPLDAMIWIIDHDSNGNRSMVFTDPDIGDYHRPIIPGTYDIVASSEGYKSDTAKNVTVTANNAVWLNFELATLVSLQMAPSFINDTVNQNIIKSYPVVMTNLGNNSVEYSSLIDFSAISDTWISIQNENGSIQPENNDTIFLVLNTNDILPGKYACTLTISDNANNQYTLPIDIYVNQIQSIELNPKITGFKLFPNPFSEYISIEFILHNASQINLSIYNTCGNIVFEKNIPALNNEKNNIVLNNLLNIQNLPNGIYFVQISTPDYMFTKKIIKD